MKTTSKNTLQRMLITRTHQWWGASLLRCDRIWGSSRRPDKRICNKCNSNYSTSLFYFITRLCDLQLVQVSVLQSDFILFLVDYAVCRAMLSLGFFCGVDYIALLLQLQLWLSFCVYTIREQLLKNVELIGRLF